jgi:predicted ATP-grasp superfamily ATP-dependent carboligase
MKTLVVGISVRAMVASAIRGGYPVLALDAFGDRDLKSLTEAYALQRDFNVRYSPHALWEASRQFSYDAVAYTSNLENYPKIIQRLAGSRVILGNSPQSVAAVRHWPALYDQLERAGFSVPETIFATDKRKADSHRRWLIKPVSGGGGHGVITLNSSEFPGSRFMLQEYIPGKACSASFVANGQDCLVLGITEQLIGMQPFGSQGFRYCGNIMPLPEITDPGRAEFLVAGVRRLAVFLTRAYGLTGVNGFDFILNGDKVYLTEVNPRYSASMELIEHAYELPIFHLHAQAVLCGSLPEFQIEAVLSNRTFFGKAILFAERNGVAPDTKGWLDSGARDIPAPGEKLHKGNPICTVFAKRPTYAETRTELIQRAALLKEWIYE